MNVLILGTTCVWLNISVWNTWMKWCIRNNTRWCALDCGDSDWSEVALVLRGRAWISPRWWQALPTNPWQWFQIPQCGGLWQPSLIHPNVYTWMKWCIRNHTRWCALDCGDSDWSEVGVARMECSLCIADNFVLCWMTQFGLSYIKSLYTIILFIVFIYSVYLFIIDCLL